MGLIENESNFNSSDMYRLQVKEGAKFASFGGFSDTEIDGVKYTFKKFINSGKFKIHEVICFRDNKTNIPRDYFHVFYEDK